MNKNIELYNRIDRHSKKLFIILVAIFIFLSMATFPIYNVSKNNFDFTGKLIFVFFVYNYYRTGSIVRILFRKSKNTEITVILYLIFTTVIGFLVRYLIEFGEVSNTYNFTYANIFVHIGVVLVFGYIFPKIQNRY